MKCLKCGCKNFEAKMIVLKDRPKYIVLKDRPKYADVNNSVWRCMQCHLPYVHQEPKKEEKDENTL